MPYCANCGQPVKGKIATAAASPDVMFCWKCGGELDDEGKCTTDDCPYFGKVPPPPPKK